MIFSQVSRYFFMILLVVVLSPSALNTAGAEKSMTGRVSEQEVLETLPYDSVPFFPGYNEMDHQSTPAVAEHYQSDEKDPVEYVRNFINEYKVFFEPLHRTVLVAKYKIGFNAERWGGGYLILQSPKLAIDIATHNYLNIVNDVSMDFIVWLLSNVVKTPHVLCEEIAKATIAKGLEEYAVTYHIGRELIKTGSISREDAFMFIQNQWGILKLAYAERLYELSKSDEYIIKEELAELSSKVLLDTATEYLLDTNTNGSISVLDFAYFIKDISKVLNQSNVGLFSYKPYIGFMEKMDNINKQMLKVTERYGKSNSGGESYEELSNQTDSRKHTRRIKHIYSTNGGFHVFFEDGSVVSCGRCDLAEININSVLRWEVDRHYQQSHRGVVLDGSLFEGPSNGRHDWAVYDYIINPYGSFWASMDLRFLKAIQPHLKYDRDDKHTGSITANRDAVVGDLTNLASMAQSYYRKPAAMGGGGGDFTGWSIPATFSSDNGTYTAMIDNATHITLVGTGTEYGDDGRNPVKVIMTISPQAIISTTIY